MSNPRMLLGVGLFANLMFWASVLGFAALRPDYSHLTDAVSELGVVGAPRLWWFNILGYALPGILTAACAFCIGRTAVPGAVVSPVLLALSGIGLLIAGLSPADMSDMRAPSTIGHVVGVTLGLAWLPGAAWLSFRAREQAAAVSWTTGLWLVALLGSYGLYAVMGETPGAVQRVSLGVWLSWHPVAALALMRRPVGQAAIA